MWTVLPKEDILLCEVLLARWNPRTLSYERFSTGQSYASLSGSGPAVFNDVAVLPSGRMIQVTTQLTPIN